MLAAQREVHRRLSVARVRRVACVRARVVCAGAHRPSMMTVFMMLFFSSAMCSASRPSSPMGLPDRPSVTRQVFASIASARGAASRHEDEAEDQRAAK